MLIYVNLVIAGVNLMKWTFLISFSCWCETLWFVGWFFSFTEKKN